jgi:hypothetical protein
MKLFDDLVLVSALLFSEPALEILMRTKNVREKEVEESPELVQVILERSARD